MTQMTALRAHRRGGPEVLAVEAAPIPVPAAGEVLVAVHAAAITFDELTWEETWTRDGVSRTPVIPSHEISGVVVETGSGAVHFAQVTMSTASSGSIATVVPLTMSQCPRRIWPPSRPASRT